MISHSCLKNQSHFLSISRYLVNLRKQKIFINKLFFLETSSIPNFFSIVSTQPHFSKIILKYLTKPLKTLRVIFHAVRKKSKLLFKTNFLILFIFIILLFIFLKQNIFTINPLHNLDSPLKTNQNSLPFIINFSQDPNTNFFST